MSAELGPQESGRDSGPPPRKPAFPAQPAGPALPEPTTSEPAAPSVAITVEPRTSAVEQPVTLEVVLTNRCDHPLVVNRRLILNDPAVPAEYGDVYLSVKGPPAYQNRVTFSVRVGPPRDEDFGLLMTGGSFSRSYLLLHYESLHLPGVYQVQVTYRNTVRTFVRGIPPFVGEVSSAIVSIERYNA
jgi:hypothetical protein